MVDRLLGDRYHLQKLLGTGGMATVYQAEDLYLHREVAVKILRSEFVQSEELVRSFRREAQSAARLSHPNIVSIYDVGETRDGQHYLVMEMVEGRTLKEVIRQRGPLGEREALQITRQIAGALQQAHARGVIHRDIKPHNILVSDRGEIKVTDFGIARAVTDATLVNTRSIVGSAHYFSPEQARGGMVDAKSDLYSLGIVLYEMLTGTVPYDGDSPITVALQHLQGELVPPTRLRPGLSEGAERITLGLLAKDPAQRYQSAEALIADLDKALAGMEPNHRLTRKRPRRRWPWLLLALLFLLAAGWLAFRFWMAVPSVRVPGVTGKTIPAAEAQLKRAGLGGAVGSHATSTKVGRGLVLAQDPTAGAVVRRGRQVRLIVSSGPPLVSVPQLTYLDLADAQSSLVSQGLRYRVSHGHSDSVADGEVYRQFPAPNVQLSLGSRVRLWVSDAAQPTIVTVPDLTNQSLKQASAALKAAGLAVSQISYQPDSRRAGTVIGQDPPGGSTVQSGAGVSLILSPGGGGAVSAPAVPQQQTLIIDVPPDLPAGTPVKVVVSDDSGDHVMYQGTPTSPQISVPVQWSGTGQVAVYLGQNPTNPALREALPVASGQSQASGSQNIAP